MRKNFNSVQMFETSDVCNKFSKSVSYETLVSGTATIGREHNDVVGIEGVITRRTSVRRGYLPEKCTHANKESLFANVTWLMRLPRRIQRMLLVMTLPALALIFTLTTTTESWAATCIWDGTKLTIIGKGDETFSVCSDGSNHKEATEVTVGEGIISIGKYAFDSARSLNSVNMPNVISLEEGAFALTTNLSFVFMPNVRTIDGWAFRATNLSSIDLPKVQSIGEYAFASADEDLILHYVGFPSNAEIDQTAFGIHLWDDDNPIHIPSMFSKEKVCNDNYCFLGTPCKEQNFYLKNGLGCVPDCGAGYLGKEGRCIDSSLGCGTGYRQFENFCNRIQYTPAEAAQVLRNDNTNSVTITFKK